MLVAACEWLISIMCAESGRLRSCALQLKALLASIFNGAGGVHPPDHLRSGQLAYWKVHIHHQHHHHMEPFSGSEPCKSATVFILLPSHGYPQTQNKRWHFRTCVQCQQHSYFIISHPAHLSHLYSQPFMPMKFAMSVLYVLNPLKKPRSG